ncbi:DNA polymerase III subunit beta [Clostridium cochlearium]|uniref:DNA polymerase III subunit beta n=1 Tax=Clostridium cochlearium TaxID=1494 RepID=UPI00241C4EC3|nr:DNA polymerase III subunit beta [Clostridium cochlearium]
MLFSVQKSILQSSLEVVSKAVGVSSTLDALKGVLITVKDGLVTLTCSDTVTSIIDNFNVLNFENGSVLVDAKMLLEYIKRLNSNDILIESDSENNSIKLKCGKSSSVMMSMDTENFPSAFIPQEDIISIDMIQEDFKDALKHVVFALAQDETRPILTGTYLGVKDGKLTAVGLDGYRLSVKSIAVDCEENFSCVIPGKLSMDFLKILRDNDKNLVMKYSDKHKRVLFEIENTTIISQTLIGDYIEYEKIMPKDNAIDVTLETQPFLESLKRVELMSKQDKSRYGLVKLSIDAENKKIVISSSNSLGQSQDEVEILDIRGESLEIAYNVKYLLEVLNVIDEESFIFKLNSPVSPAVIEKLEDKSFQALVLPVRLDS